MRTAPQNNQAAKPLSRIQPKSDTADLRPMAASIALMVIVKSGWLRSTCVIFTHCTVYPAQQQLGDIVAFLFGGGRNAGARDCR